MEEMKAAAAEKVFDIGARLRSAREANGITLDQAAKETNIRRQYLEAVENNAWNSVPGAVFVKGILRTYGNFLGLDGNSLIEKYKINAQGLAPEQAVSETIRETSRVRVAPKFKRNEDEFVESNTSFGKKIAFGVFLLAALALFAFGAWCIMGQQPVNIPSFASDQNNTPASKPSADPLEAQSKHQATTPLGKITLELKGKSRCWLEVTEGSKVIFSGMLQEGESRTFTGTNSLEVTYGNPPGVEITLNGVRQPNETAARPITRTYKEKAE